QLGSAQRRASRGAGARPVGRGPGAPARAASRAARGENLVFRRVSSVKGAPALLGQGGVAPPRGISLIHLRRRALPSPRMSRRVVNMTYVTEHSSAAPLLRITSR